MERLECHVKNYDWGKSGDESLVAELFQAGHQKVKIDQNAPYAELWMGTHPDGPARIQATSLHLSSHIAKSRSASYLSNNNHRDAIHLPFIMKIMSIKKTLSLQVHPTKAQAKLLHSRDPKNYPDRHHKPELAYAITRFELLCGFRPANEIINHINAFPPLRTLFGDENADRLVYLINNNTDPHSIKCKEALANCFRNMMDIAAEEESINSSGLVADLISYLLNLLDDGVRGDLTENTVAVMRKMSEDFPGDCGVFSPLFLNHMVLEPGQCCYYQAQELHAYLSGECVECVGCSNNTIRAAMTPKYIDREALCEVLNYRMTPPEEYLVPATKISGYPGVLEYAPDCKDFQLHKVNMEPSDEQIELPVLQCASIIIIVSGSAVLEDIPTTKHFHPARSTGEFIIEDSREVNRGDIIYIPPGTRLRFVECNESIDAYRTFSYELGPDHDSKDSKMIITKADKRAHFDLPMSESGIFEVETEMDGFL